MLLFASMQKNWKPNNLHLWCFNRRDNMSELLRNHMDVLGLKHNDIAKRARSLNQATTYRVVEGDTQNPSLHSVTSIIEAISLTDADARVLYQKLGSYHAKPRTFVAPNGKKDFTAAKIEAQNLLNQGKIQAASQYVMAMFDLAQSDDDFSLAYEQAGVIYLGLGRWEEAQVNFEAADAHLPYSIENPNTPQTIINRKHTIMTNIGTLMVKRKNTNWAIAVARSIVNHDRVSLLNKGWGLLVIGEALLELEEVQKALDSLQSSLLIFQKLHSKAISEYQDDSQERNKRIQQARGNIRWTQIHLLKAQCLLGDSSAHPKLKELELDWKDLDPEASTMAGFFFAELTPHKKRKTLILKELLKRAKRHHLGEIIQRISTLLMVIVFINVALVSQRSFSPKHTPFEVVNSKHPSTQNRGNTGS